MRKRKLQLDREVLMSNVDVAADGGHVTPILKVSAAVLTVVSALEPGFCDCLDTDSCGTDACGSDTCPPTDESIGCHTDTPGGPYC